MYLNSQLIVTSLYAPEGNVDTLAVRLSVRLTHFHWCI